MGLDYDNSAFYYFSLTMLGMYAVPMTIWVVSYTYKAFKGQKRGTEVRTTLEKSKVALIKERTAPRKVLFSKMFITNAIILVICWVVLIYLIYLVIGDSDLASFNPYLILGIDSGADAATIRKAYRGLSLQFHPDKNLGSAGAEEMFMKVAKAYEALTDAEARKNWEEFGNPDGKQALEVSIGLPTFLLDEKNHYVVLVVYLVALVVVIPVVIAAWYAHSSKYGENNVMYETYSFFLHALSEHSKAKMLPEVLAGAAENRGSKAQAALGAATQREVSVLYQRLKAGLMLKPRFEHPVVLRCNVVLHAHLYRLELSPPLRHELASMLANAPKLLDAMLELAQSQRWLQTSLAVVEFSQCVTQALFHKDHALAQLPHFGDAEVQHCIKGKGAVKTLKEYLAVPDEEKKGMAQMSDAQVQDVFAVCKLIPDFEPKFHFYVDDETEIAERDLVTLLVSMDRKHVQAGDLAPPVHAPHYPSARAETWWIFLSDQAGNLILGEKITSQDQRVEHRVKFLAPPSAGTYAFVVDLKSADYMGLDVRELVKMAVVPASTLPK